MPGGAASRHARVARLFIGSRRVSGARGPPFGAKGSKKPAKAMRPAGEKLREWVRSAAKRQDGIAPRRAGPWGRRCAGIDAVSTIVVLASLAVRHPGGTKHIFVPACMVAVWRTR
ncbi:hypothetical protein AB433_07990 [Croceicoccus naphthovorans]|uniref:Uncharacterized protein n=1 Tax=Croceicoccus naphthovorans TaxID=1348774 RepID=A0A0G3XHQ4_9SPHN|nr:hypothetical protein AB433_07990 [Croceicoccus naphthovorans]